MLYYVKSGEIDTSIRSKSHLQAAIDTLRNSDKELGICTIVSKTQIEGDLSDNMYFLTDSILKECNLMKLVN
jgi:hypothetical protein